MQACPVDAIVGATETDAHGHRRALHRLRPVRAALPGRLHRDDPPSPATTTGWDAWSQSEADAARERHDRREARLAREREAAEARAAARRAVERHARSDERRRAAQAATAARHSADRRRRSEETRDHPGRARTCTQEEGRTGDAKAQGRRTPSASAPTCRRRSTPPKHAAAVLASLRTIRDTVTRKYTDSATTIPNASRMNANKRRAIFETLQSLNPHPTTELEYTHRRSNC